MSAYIVDVDSIPRLVQAYLHYNADYLGCASPEEMGEILAVQNIRSVEARYGKDPFMIREGWLEEVCEMTRDKTMFMGDIVQPAYTPLTLVEALKSLSCLEYQSCETLNWDSCAAKSMIDRMRGTFIRCLPGYDEAPWK